MTWLVICSIGLISCTAIHPPAPYVPQKSGMVPGQTITVGANQNVYGIAQEHGVSMRDIIALNGLREPFALKPGQSLILPFRRADGTPSAPAAADIPVVPAAPLGAVQEAALAPIETQTLPPPAPAPIATGKPISGVFVSKPVPIASTAPVETLNAPSAPAPKPVPTTMAAATSAAAATVAAAPSATPPAMVWPVQGPVLSGFGPKGQGVSNDGVNIGAPKGAPVVAAASGIVVYAGNEMKGFGNLVLIRHEGGWVTAYAYLDRVLVSKDAVVAQGDMIGTVGKSGNIATPQLHFETRQGGKAVDPNGVVKN